MASEDKNIQQFHNDGVYAPENSISMYRMYSSYLNIVPKEQIPIDLEDLIMLFLVREDIIKCF